MGEKGTIESTEVDNSANERSAAESSALLTNLPTEFNATTYHGKYLRVWDSALNYVENTGTALGNAIVYNQFGLSQYDENAIRAYAKQNGHNEAAAEFYLGQFENALMRGGNEFNASTPQNFTIIQDDSIYSGAIEAVFEARKDFIESSVERFADVDQWIRHNESTVPHTYYSKVGWDPFDDLPMRTDFLKHALDGFINRDDFSNESFTSIINYTNSHNNKQLDAFKDATPLTGQKYIEQRDESKTRANRMRVIAGTVTVPLIAAGGVALLGTSALITRVGMESALYYNDEYMNPEADGNLIRVGIAFMPTVTPGRNVLKKVLENPLQHILRAPFLAPGTKDLAAEARYMYDNGELQEIGQALGMNVKTREQIADLYIEKIVDGIYDKIFEARNKKAALVKAAYEDVLEEYNPLKKVYDAAKEERETITATYKEEKDRIETELANNPHNFDEQLSLREKLHSLEEKYDADIEAFDKKHNLDAQFKDLGSYENTIKELEEMATELGSINGGTPILTIKEEDLFSPLLLIEQFKRRGSQEQFEIMASIVGKLEGRDHNKVNVIDKDGEKITEESILTDNNIKYTIYLDDIIADLERTLPEQTKATYDKRHKEDIGWVDMDDNLYDFDDKELRERQGLLLAKAVQEAIMSKGVDKNGEYLVQVQTRDAAELKGWFGHDQYLMDPNNPGQYMPEYTVITPKMVIDTYIGDNAYATMNTNKATFWLDTGVEEITQTQYHYTPAISQDDIERLGITFDDKGMWHMRDPGEDGLPIERDSEIGWSAMHGRMLKHFERADFYGREVQSQWDNGVNRNEHFDHLNGQYIKEYSASHAHTTYESDLTSPEVIHALREINDAPFVAGKYRGFDATTQDILDLLETTNMPVGDIAAILEKTAYNANGEYDPKANAQALIEVLDSYEMLATYGMTGGYEMPSNPKGWENVNEEQRNLIDNFLALPKEKVSTFDFQNGMLDEVKILGSRITVDDSNNPGNDDGNIAPFSVTEVKETGNTEFTFQNILGLPTENTSVIEK